MSAQDQSTIWQDVKSGGLYTVVGEGHDNIRTRVTIYRCLWDGAIFTCPTPVFRDGRFRNLSVEEVANFYSVAEQAQTEPAPSEPAITLDMVTAEIVSEAFHHFPGTSHTICCLTLKNGHTVIGDSTCVSPEKFDRELGCRLARGKAIDQIWPLLAFRMRDRRNAST